MLLTGQLLFLNYTTGLLSPCSHAAGFSGFGKNIKYPEEGRSIWIISQKSSPVCQTWFVQSHEIDLAAGTWSHWWKEHLKKQINITESWKHLMFYLQISWRIKREYRLHIFQPEVGHALISLCPVWERHSGVYDHRWDTQLLWHLTPWDSQSSW